MYGKGIALLVACGLAMPALGGPADDAAPAVSGNAFTPVTRGVDDPGDPCSNVDTETLTGDNRLLGIEAAWGYYWITGSGNTVGGTGQMIYQFDTDWNLVAQYDQTTGSAVWGGRDMAAIESENLLFTGSESGELVTYVFDPSTERLDLTQTETNFAQVGGTVRALAYHPGRDTFFTKDFTGLITEFDRDGMEVDIYASSISAYGAAYDPVNDTIWFNAYCTGCAEGTTLFEWDPATGTATGREIDMTDPVYAPAGFTSWIPGGLDIFMNGDQVVFLAGEQGTPRDFASIVLGDGTDGCPDGGVCYADCDESGSLDFFDFLCFQNDFASGSTTADCDASGSLDFFDFLCFQNAFAAGCP